MSQNEFNLTGFMAWMLIIVAFIAAVAILLAYGFYLGLKAKERENEQLREENNMQKEKILSLQMASYKNVTKQEIREALGCNNG